MKKQHLPGYQHVTPEPDTKGWKRIIARGCGGQEYDTYNGIEFTCDHDYAWCCDDCPILIEYQDREAAKYEAALNAMQGPPNVPLITGGETLWFPTVETEIEYSGIDKLHS